MPDFGGLINKVKDLAGKHQDQVHDGVDKAEDIAKKKLGDEHGDQIKQGGDAVEDYLGVNEPDEHQTGEQR
jgi:hypothetical protein